MIYRVLNDTLTIVDAQGEVHWRGRPEPYPVQWASAIPGSPDGVVLYHYYRPDHPYGAFPNLVRVNSDGAIVWHAELPESDDKYVSAELRDEKLHARSYGCFLVEISLENGRIVAQQLTK